MNRFLEIGNKLNPFSFKIYLYIFFNFNNNRFPESMRISKIEIMNMVEISSTTYTKSIKELVDSGFIEYELDKNAMKPSLFKLIPLGQDKQKTKQAPEPPPKPKIDINMELGDLDLGD